MTNRTKEIESLRGSLEALQALPHISRVDNAPLTTHLKEVANDG